MLQINPITKQDYPDLDVIRVNDTYYLLSTTMHFFPGGALLRSYDLVNWEVCNYLFDSISDLPGETLDFDQNMYGRGMWAPTLRYNNGIFYALFVSIEQGTTLLFTTENPCGHWERNDIKGTFYDASLLFDEDKVYIVHGNNCIRITELDLTRFAPKENGLDIVAFTDTHNVMLGYEGSHVYKINGKYLIFNIHWPKDQPAIRTQVLHVADKIEGPYTEYLFLQDDELLKGKGVAQGGIVDTPDGEWYGFFFRDNGSCGRIPMLTPVQFKDGIPFVSETKKIPDFNVPTSTRGKYKYKPLYTSDFSEDDENNCPALQWQFNHRPEKRLIEIKKGAYKITTGKVVTNFVQASNTLTQRSIWPHCSAEVTIDATHLNDGDFAGLGVLLSCYGQISISKETGYYYLNLITRDVNDNVPGRCDCLPGNLIDKIKLPGPVVRLKVELDFSDLKDVATFSYASERNFIKIPYTHKMDFRLDHFCGARFALFCYSTKRPGGTAEFKDFKYVPN